MTAALRQQVILNTRPAHQQAGLTALLEADGATVLAFPAIEIKLAPAGSADVDPADYDILLFVSRNAVDGGFALFGAAALPADQLYGVIGSATRTALHEHIGDPGTRLIESAPFNSEALLAADALQRGDGKRILIPRAGPRSTIAKSIGASCRARGQENLKTWWRRHSRPWWC